MFTRWKKNKAIKKFLRILPSHLRKRYGGSEYYTRGQVERTLEEENIGSLYKGYALAVFLSPDDAINVLGSSEIYQDLRKEIADKYFDGNVDFKIKYIGKSKVGNSGHNSTSIQ